MGRSEKEGGKKKVEETGGPRARMYEEARDGARRKEERDEKEKAESITI